jgi:hypothetical protein
LAINQTACQVREVAEVLPSLPCDRCQQIASHFSTAERVAIDLDLDYPILLLITVSVHFCARCQHYFRAQPPFLRPDASYTNRVVATAVAGVWHQRRSGRKIAITVEPLEELSAVQRRALDDQVERVGEILEGKPQLSIGTVSVGAHA